MKVTGSMSMSLPTSQAMKECLCRHSRISGIRIEWTAEWTSSTSNSPRAMPRWIRPETIAWPGVTTRSTQNLPISGKLRTSVIMSLNTPEAGPS